jgi:hypothetical protein
LKILVPTSFLRRKRMISLGDGEKKKVEWTFGNSFEGMEGSRDNVRRLKS